jgi:hypothetical protein
VEDTTHDVHFEFPAICAYALQYLLDLEDEACERSVSAKNSIRAANQDEILGVRARYAQNDRGIPIAPRHMSGSWSWGRWGPCADPSTRRPLDCAWPDHRDLGALSQPQSIFSVEGLSRDSDRE